MSNGNHCIENILYRETFVLIAGEKITLGKINTISKRKWNIKYIIVAYYIIHCLIIFKCLKLNIKCFILYCSLHHSESFQALPLAKCIYTHLRSFTIISM